MLNLAAENLLFSVSVDPPLVPLAPIRGPVRLDVGAEDSLDCYFVVGALANEREVNVRLSWSANADERDAHMFKTIVYAGRGFWERQNSPTSDRLSGVHAVNSKIAWAVGYKYGEQHSVVLRTTDGGDNWVLVKSDRVLGRTCIFAIDSLHAWTTGWFEGKVNIYGTVDGGQTWTQQNYPEPLCSGFTGLWFFDAANGYAFGYPGRTSKNFVVLQTTNGGATWTHLANEPAGVGGTSYINAFCCTDRQHMWFGAPPSLVWRTTDGGSTWSSVTAGTAEVTALAMRDDSVGLMCSGVGIEGEPTFLYRTTDGGGTWQPLQGVKPDRGYTAVAFTAGTADAWVAGIHTVACSRDYGVSWALQPIEPISSHLCAISFCDAANGWMVTDQGEILRYRERSGTNAVRLERDEKLPVQVLLQQNYPNPFNPSTTIKYELPRASIVSLRVFDMLGREVSVLLNERKDAGVHEVKFDAVGLASGVYFYRMQAGDFVQTSKLLLVR